MIKNQVECILLAAEKSCILLHGCSREHDKEENDRKKNSPPSLPFPAEFSQHSDMGGTKLQWLFHPLSL